MPRLRCPMPLSGGALRLGRLDAGPRAIVREFITNDLVNDRGRGCMWAPFPKIFPEKAPPIVQPIRQRRARMRRARPPPRGGPVCGCVSSCWCFSPYCRPSAGFRGQRTKIGRRICRRPSIRPSASPGSRRPCSGNSSSSPTRPWHVWRTTRRFVVCGFVVGRTTGMNIMVLAEPVLDDKGAVTSVVFLSLDLAWIGRQMQQMAVPPGSNVALIDGAGTIMALYPHEPDSIGQKIPELAHFMKQRSLGHVDGVHIVGKDQVSRVYVSWALPGTPPGSAFIRAGIPTAETIAQANHAMRHISSSKMSFSTARS